MAEVKWIKITTNIFDDEKIKLIESMPDKDSLIVIWFKLLTLAGKVNDNGFVYVNHKMPTTDEMLATIFNRPLNTVRMALKTFENFGMIEQEKHISICNWEKHQNIDGLDKIRVQNADRQRKFKEKKKLLSLENQQKSNVTITLGNATDIDIDKNKNNSAEIENFFEECWNLYPSKLGKASIKEKNKKEIFKLGEEFKRCIERYKKSKEDWCKWKNGSTFFNSGYVDYLDINFKENILPVQQESKPMYTKEQLEKIKRLIK